MEDARKFPRVIRETRTRHQEPEQPLDDDRAGHAKTGNLIRDCQQQRQTIQSHDSAPPLP